MVSPEGQFFLTGDNHSLFTFAEVATWEGPGTFSQSSCAENLVAGLEEGLREGGSALLGKSPDSCEFMDTPAERVPPAAGFEDEAFAQEVFHLRCLSGNETVGMHVWMDAYEIHSGQGSYLAFFVGEGVPFPSPNILLELVVA